MEIKIKNNTYKVKTKTKLRDWLQFEKLSKKISDGTINTKELAEFISMLLEPIEEKEKLTTEDYLDITDEDLFNIVKEYAESKKKLTANIAG